MSDRPAVFMLLDNPFRSDQRVEREAKALHQHGWEVHILAMSEPHLPHRVDTGTWTVERSIPGSIDSPLSRRYFADRARFASKLIADGVRRIHAHDHRCLDLAVAAKEQDPSITIIYDAHEYLAGWPLYKESKARSNRIKGWVVWRWSVRRERRNLSHCEAIITVSRSLCEEMHQRFQLKAMPVLLRNVPEMPTSIASSDLRRKFGIPPQARLVVHSGNIYHSDARIAMLLRSCMALEGTYLLLICNALNRNKVQDVMDRTHIHTNGHVLFMDYPARNEELMAMLQACDAGIVHTWQPDWPSHWYSLPNRIMEYTLCGLPILATAQPEFVAFQQEYGNCVLYAGDREQEMTAALRELLLQGPELAEKARQAKERLSWDQEVRSLLDLYTE